MKFFTFFLVDEPATIWQSNTPEVVIKDKYEVKVVVFGKISNLLKILSSSLSEGFLLDPLMLIMTAVFVVVLSFSLFYHRSLPFTSGREKMMPNSTTTHKTSGPRGHTLSCTTNSTTSCTSQCACYCYF